MDRFEFKLRIMVLAAIVWMNLPGLSAAAGQSLEGELRLTVRGPDGNPVSANIELVGRNPDFRARAETDDQGQAKLQRLPLGIYALTVQRSGFEAFDDIVEIRSTVPQQRDVTLRLGVLATTVTIREKAPLLDSSQPGLMVQVGRQQLEQALGTTLGRSTIDVISTLPGWLLEANAVLHPRGSEYDTQYVIDGIPVYDNRSIAFAPAFENDEFESVNVMTAGIPAEYGRRLGGVIALDTRRVEGVGHRSQLNVQTGNLGNHAASFSHQYRAQRAAFSFSAHGGMTDRYLDPPSVENFTNRGSAGGFNARFDQDLPGSNRLSISIRSNRTNFLVPNDLLQEAAGQRQDRRSSETAWQGRYQHVFSSRAVADLSGSFRDLTARLWSNEQSTPVYVNQNRGLREGSAAGTVTMERDRLTLKIGGDVRIGRLKERFFLAEPDELPDFDIAFEDRKTSKEASAFIQHQVRFGNFAANLGLRFDDYSLLIDDHAFSPRVALSYYFPRADLQLRASYDRIFQPPPSENLLLSSAAEDLGIDDVDVIAVPASRSHFFELGFRKPIGNVLRLDVSHYWRTFRNSIDDDVLFNTGLSFPITFDNARIEGTEVRLELPVWRWLSSTLSYSNMTGHAGSPITGGLFIEGGEAEELRDRVVHFPISQDQRNTIAAQVRVEPHRRVWISSGFRYGSGLPFELDEAGDDDDPVQPIAPEILERINFDRGRIRPNFSLDLSAGVRLWERSARSVVLQVDARNVTDRLNVINFSGVFSETALAPGRQVTLQTRVRF